VDREGWSFLAVEGAEPGKVLGAGFLELDVVADDADDVGLLLDGISEVAGVGHLMRLCGRIGYGGEELLWRSCGKRMPSVDGCGKTAPPARSVYLRTRRMEITGKLFARILLATCLQPVGLAQTSQSAPTAAQPMRIRVSAAVLGGFLEHGVQPAYPDQAIRSGIKGDVTLVVQTNESGKVVRSLAVEGDPLLVAASIEALKDFQFHPYLLSGKPISVESQIVFKFKLKGSGDGAQGTTDYSFDVPYRPEFRTGAINQDGTLVLSPRKISGPDPVTLPELSGKQGSVYLKVTVGSDGKVESVDVLGGDEQLVAPVVAAVKQSVYEPQSISGVATASVIQESYHFGAGRH